MAISAPILRSLRLAHLYIGVFIAPALLFFAITGALQTFSLHETTRGSSYQPPHWIVVLGQIHKKQTAVLPQRRPSPPPAATAPQRPAPAPPPPISNRHPLPLKIFFLLVSLGLIVSTVTGIAMTYSYTRNTRLVTGLLILGTVLPIGLVFV